MTQSADPTVINTSDKSKLPPEIAALLDPANPLPAGVIYFEKRYTSADMVRTLVIAIAFGFAAIIVIPIGIAWMFHKHPVTVYSKVDYLPFGFGIVLAMASWLMFASVGAASRLRRLQTSGQCTRMGTYLTSTLFVQASESDTTVIPPAKFKGLEGNSVKYEFNNLPKSFRLPNEWIGSTPEQVREAIMRWAGDQRG